MILQNKCRMFFFRFKVIKYWLLAHFPSFAGKKQEADELSGDASVEDDSFVKVKCQSLG